MQGFDTKWDEDILEKMYKRQLHFFEDLEPLMALYLQDTVQNGETVSRCRLKSAVKLSRKQGTIISMPAMKTGLFKRQQPGKEPKRKS